MKKIPGSPQQHLTILYAVLFLFFIQLVTEFIAAVYAFGLLGTDIPVEIVSILFFLSPLVLALFGRQLSGRNLFVLASLIIIARLLDPLLDPRGRMLVSGFGVACFLIFLPLLLWQLSREQEPADWYALGTGLTLALGLGILLRAVNSGSDLSLHGWGQLIGWLLAVIAAIVIAAMVIAATSLDISQDTSPSSPPSQPKRRQGFGGLTGLSIGVLAVFLILHLTTSSPNVIARWTGASYLSILGVLALAMGLFSLTLALKPIWISSLSKGAILAWNMLFVASLVLTIYTHQIDFPSQPSGYPFYMPQAGWIAIIGLYLMLLLSPVVLVNFMRYTQEIITLQPALNRLGSGFMIASALYLLVALAHVFTTVYAYIPLVGPIFRDRFWLVYLAAGLALSLPVLLVSQPTAGQDEKRRPGLALALVGLFAAAFFIGLWVSSKSVPPVAPSNTIRLLTYNVQQGYNPQGEMNFDGQLDLIRQADPDILGLQESDTNRLAGGNTDLVRYYADRLQMYSYYGPPTTTGTFGIALLSKYPIQNPRTFFMYSQGEQTATITAQIRVGDKALNLFVTHLGNGGPIAQQEALLEETEDLENVVAMGDFNFRPDSEQYRLTTRILTDAWLAAELQNNDEQAFNPTRRIDHIFVSPGTEVVDARFLTQPESDHPALLVDIAR
ncbi:MAG: endonuclease/exonuclease/phosphatase family protein [Anaerolineales bacterium]